MSYSILIATSFDDYSKKLVDFSKEETEIWYRGEKRHDYTLKPSAYRYQRFRENGLAVEKKSIASAKSELNHFDDAHKLSNDIDWLSYMQHYRIPTRYLDWSTEFSVPMYFAFEDFSGKDPQRNHSNKIKTIKFPTIWALRVSLFLEQLEKVFYKHHGDFGFNSSREAKKILSQVREIKDTGSFRLSEILSAEGNGTKLNLAYIPFVSSYVNERAKMQGGCFIQFPIYRKRGRAVDPLKNIYESRSLDYLVNSYKEFKGCLAKFVFFKPQSTFRGLSVLNLRHSRVYPGRENVALSIKARHFLDKRSLPLS